MKQRGVVSVVLLLVVIVSIGLFFYLKQTHFVPTISPSPSAWPMETPQAVTTETYTSKKFGIQFNHALTFYDEGKILVKEIENKIFVYPEKWKKEEGQFVEVFSKDPQDSIQSAIEKRFLKGYSKQNCYAVLQSDQNNFLKDNTHYPQSYKISVIAYPDNPDPNGWAFENAKNCPSNYSNTNGARYFLMDTNHPDKLLFFEIGQYNISSGLGDKPWEFTLTFVD